MRTTRGRWLATGVVVVALGAVAAACGGTGGGGGRKGNPADQFFLANGSNRGSLVLNVNPNEVDANKSDRMGIVATLTDSTGGPIGGVTIRFNADIDDITFIGSNPQTEDGVDDTVGFATTDPFGNAYIIAVVGSTPTATGDFLGTGTIFAFAPDAFFLGAGFQVTITDVGFVDSDVLNVVPSEITLVEPMIGSTVFFNVIGGTPPYTLTNEVSGAGVATMGSHCAPGCTELSSTTCIGSPCQTDEDCNAAASPLPAGVCTGAVKRCLASCAGTNCAGSRCEADADCNDGAASPANVCADAGQSIVYTVLGDTFSGTHGFTVLDSSGQPGVLVSVTFEFTCGNGVRRGAEQCDLTDGIGGPDDPSCADLGFFGGSVQCTDECQYDVSNCLTEEPEAMAPISF